MNIEDYGKVLKSGWGKMPPKHVIDRMKQDYDVIC